MNQETYTTTDHAAFLRLDLKKGERFLFPYAALVFARICPARDDDQERMDLTFATHEVRIHGFRLLELLDQIQKTTCSGIRETSQSHAPFGDKPAVVSIHVQDLREA